MKHKFLLHLSSQSTRLKSEGSVPGYIFWWAARLMMIFAVFYTRGKVAPALYLAICLNTLATFAVTLLSALFPEKIFLGRLSFKVQNYIDLFVLLGSFFCYCVNMYAVINDYDKLQHFLAGFLGCFLGMELLKCMFPKKEIDRRISFLCGTGFSVWLIVIWEAFEFLADFFIPGSNNQGYTYGPNYNMIFFKIFGKGAQNEGQAALFDTMFDMIFALVGIFVAIVFFLVVYQIKKRKKRKSGKERAETTEKEKISG